MQIEQGVRRSCSQRVDLHEIKLLERWSCSVLAQYRLIADMAYDDTITSGERDEATQLLQLPDTALDLVLQQLGTCSLASISATCKKGRAAVSASAKEVTVRCSSQQTVNSFMQWLEHNSNSLVQLTRCSVARFGWPSKANMSRLPCSQLHHLQLGSLQLQLQLGDGCPGVLHDCTGLTALDMQHCRVEDQDAGAAFAAIAALPELQRLCLNNTFSLPVGSGSQIPAFQNPSKKKKKGVTRVAHAATLQLNPAMEGYSQYEKGNHQDKPHP
jgi:hypothetical protein